MLLKDATFLNLKTLSSVPAQILYTVQNDMINKLWQHMFSTLL